MCISENEGEEGEKKERLRVRNKMVNTGGGGEWYSWSKLSFFPSFLFYLIRKYKRTSNKALSLYVQLKESYTLIKLSFTLEKMSLMRPVISIAISGCATVKSKVREGDKKGDHDELIPTLDTGSKFLGTTIAACLCRSPSASPKFPGHSCT